MQNFPQPYPVPGFVGRAAEVDVVARFLDASSGGLLTLVGPGGVGKTRLARQAISVAGIALEVGFISLAPLSSPDAFVSAIADGLLFSFYNRSDPKQQLLDYLREKRLLLVLDGCEQVGAAAGLVAEILQVAPLVKILVTSRERLNLPNEQLVGLEGLPFPADEHDPDFDRYAAVQLFQQSARRLEPAFVVRPNDRPHLARICRLVDGLPLALEMAAAWIRAISCQEIAQEIASDLDFLTAPFRDTPERHQSLRVVFDTSWKLLAAPDRATSRRLSIFRGGFSAAAAQAVAGALADQLATFVNKSLLRQDGPDRYALHATLRQYAADKLDQFPDEEASTQAQYCAYFAAGLRREAERLKGPQQKEALETVAAAIEDIRFAWEMAIRRADYAALDASADGLYLFYNTRSWAAEGRRAFGEAAALGNSPDCPPLLAGRLLLRQAAFAFEQSEYAVARQLAQDGLVLAEAASSGGEVAFASLVLGRLCSMAGDHAGASGYHQRALALYQQNGDLWGSAKTLDSMGVAAWAEGSLVAARQNFQQAVDIYRQMGDLAGIARGLDHLGVVARDRGLFEEARPAFEEAYAAFRDLGARASLAYAANHLGGVLAMTGHLPEAERYFEECIALGKEIGERRVVAYTLSDWGTLLSESSESEEDFARARQRLEDALQVFEAIGDQFGIATTLTNLGSSLTTGREYDAARRFYQRALHTALGNRNTRLIASVLLGWAVWLDQQGQVAAAVEILSHLLTLDAEDAQNSTPAQELMDDLAARLFPDEFERAARRGRALTQEQVVSRILAAA